VWEPTATQKLAAYLADRSSDLAAIDAKAGPEDFPCYRGVNLDGVVPLANLETDWTKHPPKVEWRHPSPGGYSGVAVSGNIAVTLEERDDGETVACYDRAGGRQRWAHVFAPKYKDPLHMGDGPRSTPTIHEGRIYSLGASGVLVCVDTEGKPVWS